MKFISLLLLVCAMVFSLAACRSTSDDAPLGTGLQPVITQPTEASEPAATEGQEGLTPEASETFPKPEEDVIPLPSQPTAPENNQDR